MDEKKLIARRVAQELKPGSLVNLGIGLPTLVAAMVPRDVLASGLDLPHPLSATAARLSRVKCRVVMVILMYSAMP